MVMRRSNKNDRLRVLHRPRDPVFSTDPVAPAPGIPHPGPALACEQALLFGRAKRVSRERASERRSREARFARPNRRACSQASPALSTKPSVHASRSNVADSPPIFLFPLPGATLGTFENQDGRHRYISTTLSSTEASLETLSSEGGDGSENIA